MTKVLVELDIDKEDLYVNQRNPADCAVCALAMFAGYSYEEFLQGYPFLIRVIQKLDGGGLNKDTMMLLASQVLGRPMMLLSSNHDFSGKRTEEVFRMFDGIPAIMSAVSLNYPNVAHAVYWDGKEIHDPSNKEKYTKETIKPFEILF